MKKKNFRREEKLDAPLTAYKEKIDAPLTAEDFKHRRQYKDHAYVADEVCYFPQYSDPSKITPSLNITICSLTSRTL